jgi:arabinofuranosyltransferase
VVADAGIGAAGHEKRDPEYVLNTRQPSYIPQMWQDYFGGAEALQGRYELQQITTRYGRVLGMWRKL